MSKLIIKEIIILDYNNKKANRFSFQAGSNLITSDSNEVGKSSLIKSIYYTLGANVSTFPTGWQYQRYIFQIKILIDIKELTIKRQDKIFTVQYDDKIEILSSEKDYAAWFQNQVGMQMQLQTTSHEVLSLAYMNAILTPYFIDQDKSWSSFYKNAIDNVSMYKDQPKVIFENIFGLSDIGLQKLVSEKTQASEIKKVLTLKISQIDSVYKSYQAQKQVTKAPAENIEKLKEEISDYLKITNELSKDIEKYTERLSKNKIALDIDNQDLDELKKLLTKTDKRYKEVEFECSYCHSFLMREQSLTRLILSDNDFEIRARIHELNHKIEEGKNKLSLIELEIEKLKKSYLEYNFKIKDLKSAVKIENFVNQKVLSELDTLKIQQNIEKTGIENSISAYMKEINALKKEIREKKEVLNDSFEVLKNSIAPEVGTANLHDRKFLDFTTVKGTGTAVNKDLLALYLIYSEMISRHSEFKFPLAMDSFIKNEITDRNETRMFGAVKEHFINLNHQTFFSVINKNLIHLDTSSSHEVKISKPMLNGESYISLQSRIIEIDD